MIVYIVIGTVWTAWLEYYTDKFLANAGFPPWTYLERAVQIVTWPVGLLYFFIILSKVYFNGCSCTCRDSQGN